MRKFFLLASLLTITLSSLYGNVKSMPQALPPFNWSEVMTPVKPVEGGQQILHFRTINKPLSNASLAFIKEHCKDAKALTSDADCLRFASDSVTLNGMYLEMGSATGRTTNFLAALNPSKIIHGFDSFEGLPEDWKRDDLVILKGTFAFKRTIPKIPVLINVKLYKGWFEDILPRFVQHVMRDQPIALLHIDCDIYSATATALKDLEKNIKPGTIIVFDEFYNYPGCENHEQKAFNEFIARTGMEYTVIAYNSQHEQVVIRMQ